MMDPINIMLPKARTALNRVDVVDSDNVGAVSLQPAKNLCSVLQLQRFELHRKELLT